jgi:hypothetical protein
MGPQTKVGYWHTAAEGSSTPGAPITALPWGNDLALFITDPNGGVYATLWNPQARVGFWSYVQGISAKPGSPVTAVPYGEGLALFVADFNGGIYVTTTTKIPLS